MAKLKTKKAISERVKVTGRKKLVRRAANQNHFRSRKTGDKIRETHGKRAVSKINERQFKKYLPYA
jgi:ribosomal protein L35